MSTTPLTDAITALTTYSNTVTGASDTDLSSAVATLAAGYGGGGGMREVSVAVESDASYGKFNAFASRYIESNANATYYICFVIFENNGSATRAGISALYYKTPTGSGAQTNRVGALAKAADFGCDIIAGATIHMYYTLEDDAIWADYYTA